jgi:hypothetical protein
LVKNELKKDDGSPPSDRNNDRGALGWLGYGIEFVGVLAIFTFFGWWADQKLHHGFPWLMLVGMFAAMTGMIYLLIKETASWRK